MPDNLTRFAPLNSKATEDPSPRPSPLPLRRRDSAASRKGTGGTVSRFLANRDPGQGRGENSPNGFRGVRP
jgi:hypothetical protein